MVPRGFPRCIWLLSRPASPAGRWGRGLAPARLPGCRRAGRGGTEAFATTLVFPDITQALQGAQPLDDPVAIRFPASVRRRYERLHRFPQQLLVTGDAGARSTPSTGKA